jgi:hypothetical protein
MMMADRQARGTDAVSIGHAADVTPEQMNFSS